MKNERKRRFTEVTEKRDEWLDAESEDAPAEIAALLKERAEIDTAYQAARAEKEAAVPMDRWRIANLRQVPLVDRNVLILLRVFRLGAEPGEWRWDIVDERHGGKLGRMPGSKAVTADATPEVSADAGPKRRLATQPTNLQTFPPLRSIVPMMINDISTTDYE
jgi:hypothetical protein